jgi:flagellar motor switch protein FliN/FliY
MEKTAPNTDGQAAASIQRLLGLRVPVVVKLAGKKMSVSAVSQMMVGTIIEFDTSAEGELDLMIRDKPIGLGIAVRVGEHYGVRITSICDVRQTIEAMR